MANRRMFSLDVVDTDKFLDMPATSQNLYFHLGMRADDDGFVSSPKKITKLVNCGNDDLNVLISRGYVIPFDDGVIVIADWNINNWIRPDRKHGSRFCEHLSMLQNNNGVYQLTDSFQPNVNQMPTKGHTEDSIDKDSIDKDSKNNTYSSTETVEIIQYLNEKAGTKYKTSSKKTQTCIHARTAEGYTVDDFKTVIDKKCREWLGTEFAKFLRPETLFGPKFESYLNAPETAAKQEPRTRFDNFEQRERNYDDLVYGQIREMAEKRK